MNNEIEFGKRYVVVSKTSTHRGMIVTAVEKCKGHCFDDIIIVKPDDDRAFRITVGTEKNPTLRPATFEDEVCNLPFKWLMKFCDLMHGGLSKKDAFENVKMQMRETVTDQRHEDVKKVSETFVRDTMVGTKPLTPLCSIAGGCQICDSQSNAFCAERMFEARSVTRDE